MSISAADIKNLRQATGSGILDCRKALEETNNDFDAAVELLRKKGAAKAVKKLDRVANEGLVHIKQEGDRVALVQVSCETDFVAKNDKFKTYLTELADKVIALDADGDVTSEVAESEKENIVQLIATIGENMQVARALSWKVSGKLTSYIHGGGRVGVLAEIEGDVDESFAKNLGMHIAAFNPTFLNPDAVPADAIETERRIAADKAEGKPDNIVEKIVNGTIEKWFADVCLVKQNWIMDDKTSIEKLFPNITIKRFANVRIGK